MNKGHFQFSLLRVPKRRKVWLIGYLHNLTLITFRSGHELIAIGLVPGNEVDYYILSVHVWEVTTNASNRERTTVIDKIYRPSAGP